jgi:teichuronic acid biosynthesis glycosyltransferase TuaG
MPDSQTMPTQPQVSIVMPIYNSAQTVRRSIESVLHQTFGDWELLLVDDCSTDSSMFAISSFLTDPRVRLFATPANSGPAPSRNVALTHASGTYVAFLDSDDRWEHRKLEIQVAFADAGGHAVTYCAYKRETEDGVPLDTITPAPHVSFNDMLIRNHIPMLTGMYHRKTFHDARFINTRHEDYVFWTQLLRKHGSAFRVPIVEPLASYTVRHSSLSGNKIRAARWHWHNLRTDFKLGVLPSIKYLAAYFIYHAARVFKHNSQ